MKHFRVSQTYILPRQILRLRLLPAKNKDMFDFTPGQYAALGFRNGSKLSPMRCFSIVSSPNSPYLEFAIKIQGDFTNALAQLKEGQDVFVQGPFGDFVLDEKFDKNVIFLAAGIGVTPFVSILRDASERNLPNRFTLLYSTQNHTEIALHEEIRQLEKDYKNFNAAYFITRGDASYVQDAHAVQGRIDNSRLQKITGGQFNRFSYFICGPGQFIDDMKDTLEANGTDSYRVVSEEFTASSNLSALLAPKDKISKRTYSLSAATLLLGIAFIMTLDISRALPKLTLAAQAQNAAATAAQASQAQTSSGSGTSSPSSSSSNSSASNSQSSSSQSSQTNNSPSYSTTYQQPMTTMS